jgi:hypothetical protein
VPGLFVTAKPSASPAGSAATISNGRGERLGGGRNGLGWGRATQWRVSSAGARTPGHLHAYDAGPGPRSERAARVARQ